ncbi:MAG: DUF4118 domain-containing protein [Candidatus Limnocylindrales bacterium]
MTTLVRGEPEQVLTRLGIIALALAAATVAAAALQAWLGVADASVIYLLAVVVIAGRFGTWSGVGTSVVAFLIYDFLFTAPRFTFNVTSPQEWLSLLLFLVVAVVIGRLAALQAERASEADRRAREAQAMFGISRALATADTIDAAAPEILERLMDQASFGRVWVGVGPTPETEEILASSSNGLDLPDESTDAPDPWVLVRTPGDEPAEWIRPHEVASRPATAIGVARFRILIEADGEVLGSLWGERDAEGGLPGRGATRSLSLAADQLGLAIRRERLAALATTAEIARRSDALKSALLDSVSHDLRTPLATIRALAGGLLDDGVPMSTAEVRESATSIDEEALRLSDLVRGLLDLSRIEAGELRPDLALHELGELVETVLRRHHALEDGRRIEVDIPDELAVMVDALFFDQALTNVYENALAYSRQDALIRLRATAGDPGSSSGEPAQLIVEDSGPGLDPVVREHVFDKFFRGQGVEGGSRHGLGIGLTIARGMTEAMGGQIEAGPSELGGLAITFRFGAGR